MARTVSVRRSGRGSAGARMTFLKRPLAYVYVCMYACLYLAFLFASFWSGNDYVTRVRGRGPEPRSGVTCTFAFHEVARMEKEIVHACEEEKRGRGTMREQRGKWQRRANDAGARIRGAQPKGQRGEWMGKAEVGEPHATSRAPRDGLRGCITCLLPDHKPPTKTLMSNVNGDNAGDPFSIRDLFARDRRSENLKVTSNLERR